MKFPLVRLLAWSQTYILRPHPSSSTLLFCTALLHCSSTLLFYTALLLCSSTLKEHIAFQAQSLRQPKAFCSTILYIYIYTFLLTKTHHQIPSNASGPEVLDFLVVGLLYDLLGSLRASGKFFRSLDPISFTNRRPECGSKPLKHSVSCLIRTLHTLCPSSI